MESLNQIFEKILREETGADSDVWKGERYENEVKFAKNKFIRLMDSYSGHFHGIFNRYDINDYSDCDLMIKILDEAYKKAKLYLINSLRKDPTSIVTDGFERAYDYARGEYQHF